MFAILALFPIERTHEEVKCVEQTFGSFLREKRMARGYIMDREIVRAALRTAREADATDQEWQDFIDRINRRMRSSGEDSDTKA